MTTRRPLRKALWSDRDLDEQARDLRDIFGGIPEVELREHEGLYAVGGITLAYDRRRRPVAIELVRCIDPANPEAAVAHGTATSFRLTQQGAELTRIDGLTAGGSTRYRMTFRITYGSVS